MNRTLKTASLLAALAATAGCAYEEPLMQPLPQGPGSGSPYYSSPGYGYGPSYGYGAGYYGYNTPFYYDYYGNARPGYIIAGPYPYNYYRGPAYYCRDADRNGRCDGKRNDGDHDGDHDGDGHHGGQGNGHGNGQGNGQGNGEPPYLIRGRDVRNVTRSSGATPQVPTPSSTPQLQASPPAQAIPQSQKTPKVQSTPKAPRVPQSTPTGRTEPSGGKDRDGDGRRGRDVLGDRQPLP